MNSILKELKEIAGLKVTDSGAERCCYASDASQIVGFPDFIIKPDRTVQVSQVLKLCSRHDVPVTPRGAGTGLAGGASPVKGGIVMDLSGMNRITEIDISNLQVLLEPGVVQEKLNQALKPHGFFFPPDPGSTATCTIGGMIANNSSGMRSIKYGTTRNYVLDLEVVLADGRVIKTGSKVLKSSAGYDLTRLLVGSEGTLGVITKAGLKIVPLPQKRRLVLTSFENATIAGMAVLRVLSNGISPSACEILDKKTCQVLKKCDPNLSIPNDSDVILFEVDGTESSTKESATEVAEVCRPLAISVMVVSSQKEMDSIWAGRRLVGAAVSRIDPAKTRIYVSEDVGVPMKKIPDLIDKVEQITDQFNLPVMKYGHIGDGNLHLALFIDVTNQDEWERLRQAADKIHKAALSLGGTVSSEHGIGLARAEYLSAQLGESLEVMKAIKRALDPQGILNPGKLGL